MPCCAFAQEAAPTTPGPPAIRGVCVDAGATDQRTLDRIAAELGRIEGVRVDCAEHDVRFYLFVERLTDAEGAVLGWYGALTYRTADMPPMALNLQTYTGPDYDDVFLPAFLRVAVAAILPRLR